MENNKSYFVVEFRLPITITDQDNAKDAAIAAAKICEKQYGIHPSSWFARVFEYGDINEGVGVVAEYFANPTGTNFRKVDGNVSKHEEIIQKQKSE